MATLTSISRNDADESPGLRLESDDASVVLATAGGRVASLRVRGEELLAAPAGDAPRLLWGCYPMVPWAGRLRHGRFSFAGRDHQMPCDLPPHAIHGTGHHSEWEVVDAATTRDSATMRLELREPWPFGGWVEHRASLRGPILTLTLALHAVQSMPVVLGWHPCFRRQVAGREASLSFEPGFVWTRDADGIPNGARAPVPPRPWDDCFGDVAAPPVVSWPGFGSVTIRSPLTSWVVYDERTDVVCVEPQTQPPDAFNHAPTVLDAGATMKVAMDICWEAER